MATYIYVCRTCGVAFQAEVPDEAPTSEPAAEPGCPKCDSQDTARIYAVPTSAGGCTTSGC